VETARTFGAFLLAGLLFLPAHPGRLAAGALENPADVEAIRGLIAETTAAFNAHDAKAVARQYTEDAWLVTVRGEAMTGTAQIESGLASIFESRAKSARLQTLDVSIRFLRPDVAVAHVLNELSGLKSPRGETLPAHRELSIRVLVKDDGLWRVTAFHNTIVRSFGPEGGPAKRP
jgi:uncharacterized protein (TIGR02246 family)